MAFVISANMTRRHLDTSQRAMVAGRLATLERGGSNQHRKSSIDTLRKSTAAKLMHVGTATVTKARTVLTKGTQGLQQAVDTGQIAITTAPQIAKGTEVRAT